MRSMLVATGFLAADTVIHGTGLKGGSLRKTQLQHVGLPLLLKDVHVLPAQYGLERVVAGWILAAIGVEAVIELPQQTALLEVVAQVPGLGVVRPLVLFVELLFGRCAQGLERGDALPADRFLQTGQTPVRAAADPAALFTALLVKRTEPFVQPRRAFGEIGCHEGVHDLVDQRASAGADVHHQRAIDVGEISVGRVGRLVKDALAVREVALLVFEEPDVQDLLGVFRKIGFLEPGDGPLHSLAGPTPHHLGRFIAQDDERRHDDDRETRGGNLRPQQPEMLGVFGRRERPGRLRNAPVQKAFDVLGRRRACRGQYDHGRNGPTPSPNRL